MSYFSDFLLYNILLIACVLQLIKYYYIRVVSQLSAGISHGCQVAVSND